MDQSFADALRTKHFLKVTKPLPESISKTSRTSPQQEDELSGFAKNLGIDLSSDPKFRMARELWAADHGEQVILQPIDVHMILWPREKCYLHARAECLQKKSDHQVRGFYGFFRFIRIGLGRRVGNVLPLYKDTAETKTIAKTGHIFITDQRIIFEGGGKSMNVAFNQLLEIKPFRDGIELVKTGDQNDFLRMTQLQSEYATLVLQTVTGSPRT